MKLVQKENRQLRIEDSRLPEFLSKGYVEVTQAEAERPQEKNTAQRKKGKAS